MEWKLSDKAEQVKKEIEDGVEELSYQFGCSDGFWYSITDGGYFDPKEVLVDDEQIEKIVSAIQIVKDFEDNVYNKIVEF